MKNFIFTSIAMLFLLNSYANIGGSEDSLFSENKDFIEIGMEECFTTNSSISIHNNILALRLPIFERSISVNLSSLEGAHESNIWHYRSGTTEIVITEIEQKYYYGRIWHGKNLYNLNSESMEEVILSVEATSSTPFRFSNLKTAENTDLNYAELVTFYTKDAVHYYGSKEETERKIAQYVNETNIAFQNSGVKAYINSIEVSYNNTSNRHDAADRRNELCADVAATLGENWVHDDGTPVECGNTERYSPDGNALNIVACPHGSDKFGHFTFTHELGHVWQANHDPSDASHCVPHCGYQNCKNGWRTVMSKACKDSTSRILYFSNPNIIYQGDPTGTAQADNVSQMNFYAPKISAYNGGDNGDCGPLSSGIGTTVDSYRWTNGWTSYEFYECDDDTYMLHVMEEGVGTSGNNAHVKEVNDDGSIGISIQSFDWSEGWTTFKIYESDDDMYMLQVKKKGTGDSGSNARIREVHSNGMIGSTVETYQLSEGWTSFEFYTIDDETYMLQFKEQGTGGSGYNGHVKHIRSDGSIGHTKQSFLWQEGYTTFKIYEVDGNLYLLQLRQFGTGDSGNNVHIRPIDEDGEIGEKIASYYWGEGWTNVDFYEMDGQVYMLQVMETGYDDQGKNAYIKRVNLDGTIGVIQHAYDWTQYWTTFEFFQSDQKTYLFQSRETGVDEFDKNAYVKNMH